MKKIIFSIFILFAGCSQTDQTTKWYEETKAEILRQSDMKADSSSLEYNEDSTFNRESFYLKGHKFRLIGSDTNGGIGLETHYSKDGNFELRREVCENGTFRFEGIYYINKFYGLSTWSYCDGRPSQQGVRYKSEKIGIWKDWDETGKLTEEKDFGKKEKLDSMPQINK